MSQGDSPWQTWEALLTVPEKADSVAVEAGLNGNKGQVGIDDVRIEKRNDTLQTMTRHRIRAIALNRLQLKTKYQENRS